MAKHPRAQNGPNADVALGSHRSAADTISNPAGMKGEARGIGQPVISEIDNCRLDCTKVA
jgi:hypothetical protein